MRWKWELTGERLVWTATELSALRLGSVKGVFAAPKLEAFRVVTVFSGFTGVTVTTLVGTATDWNEKSGIFRYVLVWYAS